jgi:ribosome-associated protein
VPPAEAFGSSFPKRFTSTSRHTTCTAADEARHRAEGRAASIIPHLDAESAEGRPIAIHPETAEAVETAVATLDDKKGIDALAIDVSTVIVVTDVFIIVSGTSRRHVLTLAEEVEASLKPLGRRPLRREGTDDGKWVLLDFGDIVVHVFDPETREYYDLARLWSDAPRLEVAVG